MSRFASFWNGPPLSAFEASCLHSFVRAGHETVLYSYEPVGGLPTGVRNDDARQIIDDTLIAAFLVDGAPSVSHFSDYFRYVMFVRTDFTWIDTDVMLLHDWSHDPTQPLLALEAEHSICNAIMRLPSDAAWLPELVIRTRALAGTRMRWGETGPRLITQLAGAQATAAQALPPHLHFPLHFDEFWKVFLPEHAAECRAKCAEARTLHLWNNIVDRLGFWKDFLPPEGSYLHGLFVEHGCEPLFRGVFPLRNMRQLVENWQSRQNGQHLGIRSVVRQVVPSIRRTFRHYAG